MATKIPAYFASGHINANTTAGAERKRNFHRDAPKILAELADEIGLEKSSYEIKSNLGGQAVSGEVILHGEGIYIKMFESAVGTPGIQMQYRSCKGRRDMTGGPNQAWPTPTTLNIPAMRGNFIRACKNLLGTQASASTDPRQYRAPSRF